MTFRNKTYREPLRVIAALFLSMVLVGSLLIKPAHILLVHHDRLQSALVHADNMVIVNMDHHDCAICNFEFCSFIPQKQAVIPQVNIVYIAELASRTIACFVSNSSHLFQLRAPPAA